MELEGQAASDTKHKAETEERWREREREAMLEECYFRPQDEGIVLVLGVGGLCLSRGGLVRDIARLILAPADFSVVRTQ